MHFDLFSVKKPKPPIILPLSIEKIDKTRIQLDFSDDKTIDDLLNVLRNKYDVPQNQSVVFKFKELDPSRTLRSYLIGKTHGTNLQLRSFEKREELKAIEIDIQRRWEKEKTFQENADDNKSRPKYMVTFPFPYMNGLLHCGHGFSLSKAEFASGYQRLKGKKVLFPFAFHCTGMPIVASAKKLEEEINKYGDPPVFPSDENNSDNNTKKSTTVKKKGKIASKKSKNLYQYEIMRELGIPEEKIKNFVSPNEWTLYFSPKCVTHLKRFGAKFDERRSFLTTQINPYFDRFVEWQFNKLREKNIVRFGKRLCIFSPLDKQPCADHDRASGEGVLPQEYTVIKMKISVNQCSERNISLIKTIKERLCDKIKSDLKKGIFLLAGTLRPETMYGQTNCFVKPNGEYIAFVSHENEIFICSEQSAKNMSFQKMGYLQQENLEIIHQFKGWDLLGLKIEAPNSIHKEIFVLPLLNINMNKATAIVTSVPSDSPDDYINYTHIQKNESYRKKYYITEEMVNFEIIPIIQIKGYSSLAAKDVCEKLKIKSPNDEKLLKQAKDEVYLKGFYKGELLVGDHKGQSVESAKESIRKALIDKNEAFAYFEPAEMVVSRSGDVCVVAETDQWFIHYGEEPYKSMVYDYVKNEVEFFSEDTRKQFLETVDWLKQWACSRKFGLGTKLPFSKEWLIESLSDSTIYMAFYTISHFFSTMIENIENNDKIDFEAQFYTDEVFDSVFLDKEIPSNIKPEIVNIIKKMQKEFKFWYPFDLRVSGKDLINNHLVMCLYNHAFLFPKSKWPKAMFVNGHTMINAEKMSKSTGNFMTLIECVEQYGADATRLTFADAGDGLDDANFAPETCNAAIIRLTKEMHWIKQFWPAVNSDSKNVANTEFEFNSDNGPLSFWDLVFDAEINLAIKNSEEAFDNMKFKIALNKGFYFLCNAKNSYISMCKNNELNKAILKKYIESIILIAAPICSHWSEHLWDFTGHKKSIFIEGKWPSFENSDQIILRKAHYIRFVSHEIRISLQKLIKNRKNSKNGNSENGLNCCVIIAEKYPEWKCQILDLIKKITAKSEINDFQDKKIQSKIMEGIKEIFKGNKKRIKDAMMFSAFILKEVKENGMDALDLKMPFDEKKTLEKHSENIFRELSPNLKSIKVKLDSEISDISLEEIIKKDLEKSKVLLKASPGNPSLFFAKYSMDVFD